MYFFYNIAYTFFIRVYPFCFVVVIVFATQRFNGRRHPKVKLVKVKVKVKLRIQRNPTNPRSCDFFNMCPWSSFCTSSLVLVRLPKLLRPSNYSKINYIQGFIQNLTVIVFVVVVVFVVLFFYINTIIYSAYSEALF